MISVYLLLDCMLGMSMINGRKFRVSPKSGNQIAQRRVSIVYWILKDAGGKYLA